MNIQFDGRDLTITQVKELGLAEAVHFRDRLRSVLPEGTRNILIDLSQTACVDCSGLGALIALHNQARSKNCRTVRVINLRPPVRRLLQLTKTERLFS